MSLKFYEKVRVIGSARFPAYAGKIGVVLAISEDESKVYSYSVFFPDEPEGLNFLPSELQSTGEFADRSEFYDDNDIIRVRVKDGKGSIAER